MQTAKKSLNCITLDVSEALISDYAGITGDYNPIHVDPEFAAQTEMGGVIAHGTMSLNLIWQALEKTLGAEALALLDLDVRFRRPVRPGDCIMAGGKLDDDNQTWSVWVENQHKEKVIEGTASPAQ